MPSNEEIASRLDCRPGYAIVAYKEVGLPVFRLSTLLTLQEDSRIGPIEEYVLRAIEAGVNSVDLLTSFLGLPPAIVQKQLGDLGYEGLLSESNIGGAHFSINKRGQTRLADAKSSSIIKQQLPVYIDGLTRDVVAVETRDLYSAAQLEAEGLIGILPIPRRAPRASEIDLIDINRVFETIGGKQTTRQAIRLDAVVGKTRLYFRKAVAVAFKSENGKAISIAFAIDGRISEEHEAAYNKSADGRRSKVFGPIFDPNKRRRGIQSAQREIRRFLPNLSEFGSDNAEKPKRILTLKNAKSIGTEPKPSAVKSITVYQHAPLLDRALTSAQDRVLILSPWIRAAVVNASFVKKLSRLLERNVNVYIGYGLGVRDRGERDIDLYARQSLEKLAAQYERMHLLRKGNTHAKVLLVDKAFFVTSSFNWLSFRGNPDDPFREELGIYVEGDEIVDYYFDQLKAEFTSTNTE